MKSFCYFILFVLVVGAFVVPAQQALAQSKIVGDTMYVDWQHPTTHLPIPNALRNAVMGDTLAGKVRKNLNRVYLLLLNGLYWEADRIENSGFNLTIVGQQYNLNDANNYPAQLQLMDLRDDGTTGDSRLITGQSNVTLKNLYITGRTNSQGVQTSYQPIQIDASKCRFVVDNCIIEQSNFAVIAYTATGNKIFYTNNKFRNLIGLPSTQQWEGRGITIWADQDSVVVENNTFFNVNFTPFQLEGGSAKYVRINHNTFVNVGRGINTGNWWQNAYITNNLHINCWWHGEGWSDMHSSGRDPRSTYAGLYTVGALPSIYGPNEGRRIVIGKQYAYLDPKFTTFYKDTIQRAYFVDPVSKLDYLNIYTDHMNVGKPGKTDTVWLSSLPAGLGFYPLTDAAWQQPKFSVTGATMADSMWRNITMLRAGLTPATPYFYKPVKFASDAAWPLPEKFSYTDATLMTAGTDGLPIGDLNWFPTQKATFTANQTQYVAAIENLAGPVIVTTVTSSIEAEKATVTSPATVQSTQGLTFFNYNGSGSLTWTFNVTSPGLYDTKWLLHMTDRGQSGPVLGINGVQFVDRAHGWGQFVMDPILGPANGLSKNAWVWVPIVADSVKLTSNASATSTFTLAAGANTIGVMGGGWGAVRFAEIDIVKHGGTDTMKLKAPDAVPVLVTPGAVGVAWVASGFKFVNMGTNGSISLTVTAPTTGNYHLRVFGQNITGSPATLTLKEGSTTLTSPVLPFKTKPAGGADSAGNDVFSGVFPLTAGNHTLVLSGSSVNIDHVQLIKEDIASAVENEGDLPVRFALEQNYPNPFNPTTTIKFSVGKASNVKLVIFNLLGQKVETILDTRMNAGTYTVPFDASRLSSGVYFYRLEAGDFLSLKKMMLLK